MEAMHQDAPPDGARTRTKAEASAAPPRDDDLVASLPVYLSASLPDTARLQLFQYPLYRRGRPLPVPASAAARGQHITSRWRPNADRVEMELPLDMREAVYDADKGAAMGEASQRIGHIGEPGHDGAARGGAMKPESDVEPTPPRFDRMRLESSAVPNATHYLVGTVHQGELHLAPLHSILQLRPSMRHVDAMSDAEDAEARRERGGAPDDEGAADSGSTGGRGGAGVIPLNVSLRNDPGMSRGSGAAYGGTPGRWSTSGTPIDMVAAQREADAERWVDLRWLSAQDGAAALLAQSRAPLRGQAHAQDYL